VLGAVILIVGVVSAGEPHDEALAELFIDRQVNAPSAEVFSDAGRGRT
jgi:hypothetical protein